MAIGSCDPASRGMTFNSEVLDRGPCRIDFDYTWDGQPRTEEKPDCDGPIIRGPHLVNQSATLTWYVRLPNKKKGNKWYELTPGLNITLSAQQRNQLGIENAQDVRDAQFESTPE